MPSWLSNFVLPKIRTLVGRKEVPDNLWRQCPGCEQTLFQKDLVADLMVCRHCGHHFRIGSGERFRMLFDGAAFETVELPKYPTGATSTPSECTAAGYLAWKEKNPRAKGCRVVVPSPTP